MNGTFELEGRIRMNATTRSPGRAATSLIDAVWPPLRRRVAMVLLVLIATASSLRLAGASPRDAAMFNEQGEAMGEDEADAIRAATRIESADTSPDFELTLFQTALHDAGEKLRPVGP